MGICEYCGEKPGWFQSSHPACVAKADSTGQAVRTLVFNGILAGRSYADLSAEVQQVLADNKVKEHFVHELLLQGADNAVSQLALQSPVSVEEWDRLFGVLKGFNIDAYRSEFVARRWYGLSQLAMSCILWEVLHDVHPGLTDPIQFNLRSGEKPLYQTGNTVTYLEERTISNHVRSFRGLSLPIGAGVYYHIGGSQGHQERTSGLLPLDSGNLLITSHALYFGGQKTTLRIPLDRVLRYEPYLDGVGVCESHGSPKVFTFDHGGMDTGWFSTTCYRPSRAN